MRKILTVFIIIFSLNASAFERYMIADLVDEIQPAVVNIKAEENITKSQENSNKLNPFAKNDKQKALGDLYDSNSSGIKEKKQYSIGSGVIVSGDGYLITNYHVVELATKIKVTTNTNKLYEAKLVGFDSKSDLALLKIDTQDKLDFVKFGDSNKVRVGEFVIAIGNPYGLDGSVSMGIISARNRNIGTNIYDDFLQTDASINPGNSGGPLFNLNGEIIGINTAIFSKTGESNGIGFAISSNAVKLIIKQLKQDGKVTRGWLGIQAQQLDSETAKSLKLKNTNGILVTDVTKNSPAYLAGVKSGDVIVNYNGKVITSLFDVPKMVAETKINDKIFLEVLRNGVDIRLHAIIVEQGKLVEFNKPTDQPNSPVKMTKVLGLYIADNNDYIAQEYSLKNNTGIVVAQVEDYFKKYRVIGGDIILQVNQKPVSSKQDVVDLIQSSSSKSILLFINRHGNNIFRTIEK